MGCLQQTTLPVPALVTINSVPHLAQRYRFPISLAISVPPFNYTIVKIIIIFHHMVVNVWEPSAVAFSSIFMLTCIPSVMILLLLGERVASNCLSLLSLGAARLSNALLLDNMLPCLLPGTSCSPWIRLEIIH